MQYFSYGSNMSILRIMQRAPSVKKVAIGYLAMHRLKFHKVSNKDGSGKCDVHETGIVEDRVYGVVYDIPEYEKKQLDKEEGLGNGYDEKVVQVMLANGGVIDAITYVATNIDASLRPLDWYKEHVMRGARQNQLPVSYVKEIEAVEYDYDTDAERRKRELAIYD